VHAADPIAPKDGFELAPAHPEDPLNLDFTSLVDTTPHPDPPEPTPEHLDSAVIGAHALGEEGFHVMVARPRGQHPANNVVLIVDDDLPTAELAAHVLRKAGYQAAVAGTPHDAARQISRLGAPALVILDIELPEMSGIEFLRRMRAHKRLKDTPVILFTAHSGRQDIVRGLQAGADGYIAKPVSASALVSAVKTVLDA
jgi:CheY-like chemotaxis protein